MIIAFQKDHAIIRSSQDEGAGNYGPKTKSTLISSHGTYTELRDAELLKIESGKALLISARNEWENTYKVASYSVVALGSPKRGDTSEHISTLQKALKVR